MKKPLSRFLQTVRLRLETAGERVASLRALLFALAGIGIGAFVLFSVAFQVPYTYHILIGSPADRQLVGGGIYPAEELGGHTFRWTRRRAEIRVPALTRGLWQITLTLDGWQPEGPARVKVSNADGSLFDIESDLDWNTFTYIVEMTPGLRDDMRLFLDSPTFRPSREIQGSTDTRILGVKLDDIVITPAGAAFYPPPFLTHVLPLTLTVLFAVITAWVLGFSLKAGIGFGAGLTLALALLVAWQRIYLSAEVARTICAASGVDLVLALLAIPLLARLFRRLGIETGRDQLKWLGAIVFGAWTVKVIGIFHPQIFIIDALFHLHRLEFVEQGNLFFVTRSREFGSLETVYPPALYLFLSPLGTFISDDMGLLNLALPTLEAIGGLTLFALARKAGLDLRAGLFAVLLYLAAPLAFITFGWGVYTNLFAQQLLVLILAVWLVVPWRQKPVFSFLGLSFLLLVGILAHASMLFLLGVFWGIFIALSWLLQPAARRRALLTGLALGLAVLIAFALYFSFFLEITLSNLDILQTRAGSTNGEFERIVGGGLADVDLGLVPVRVHSAGEWILSSAAYLARETWVYYRSIPMILALAALIELWRTGRRDLTLLLGAGFMTVLVYFFVGMLFNLYTRYMLFGAPFIALGAGYGLDRLAKRGLPGRVIVLGIVLVILTTGLGFWWNRVVG